MMVDNRNGTMVRGADGVLYVVSADTCQYVDQDSNSESFPDEVSTDVRCTVGEDDYASARALIDPGDHASARALIDPGDYAAA